MDKKFIYIALASTLLITVFITVPRGLKRGGFPLSIEAIKILQDGKIQEIESEYRQIRVLITDPYGDSHWHILSHEGVSQKEALEILAQKKSQLEAK